MKKSFLLLLAMISLSYYAGNAHAGFLLEPYAGMQFNSTYDVDGGGDGNITGTAVGARVGFQNLGLMLGIDGRRSSWTLEPKTGSDSDYTFTQLSFFVGYDFPMMLRVWGEYVFSMSGEDDDNSSNKLIGGSGTVLGIGYKVVPFVSLNFEISNLATDEFENATSTTSNDISYTSYLLGISFPISL